MVEYLGGNRIQGSSIVSATPTHTQLFENSSDSSLTGDNNTGGSSYFNVDSTVADALYFDPRRSSSIFGQTWDLGSNLSETSWVLRSKVNITSLDNTGDTVRLFFGMANQNSTVGAGDTSNNFIGVANYINVSGQQWYRVSVKGNTMDVGEANQRALTTETLYIEIIRKSETKYSVRLTNNSDFTGGTFIDDETVGSNGGSGSTSSMNLRYVWWSNINVNGNQNAHEQGNVEYVKIWNGVTTTTEDEKDSLTNVPANTRYEETDTRKIYRRVASGTTSQETQNGGELFNDVEIVAQKFTSGSSKIGLIVDSVDVYLRNDTGSVSTSTDIECKIGQEWSSGVSYGTKSPSALSTSYSWQNFTPASAKRTIVENDRLMIRWADGTVTDDSIRWGSDNNASNQLPNETGEYSSDDGSNWTARSFDRCYKINYSARWIERNTA